MAAKVALMKYFVNKIEFEILKLLKMIFALNWTTHQAPYSSSSDCSWLKRQVHRRPYPNYDTHPRAGDRQSAIDSSPPHTFATIVSDNKCMCPHGTGALASQVHSSFPFFHVSQLRLRARVVLGSRTDDGITWLRLPPSQG